MIVVERDNPDGAFYPADYDLPNVVSVTAIDRPIRQDVALFRVREAHVHLCAPGDIIWSTVRGNGYNFASGTSEATGYATGVATLLKAQDSSRDWRAIQNLILAAERRAIQLRHSQPHGQPSTPVYSGAVTG